MHRGHLDPSVATLPLAAERCAPVIARAAQLFRELRAIGVGIIHVVTEYRESDEIATNPFWRAIHDDPTKARKGILHHNLTGGHGTEIIPALYAKEDLVVIGKKRYSAFYATDLKFLLQRRLHGWRGDASLCPTAYGSFRWMAANQPTDSAIFQKLRITAYKFPLFACSNRLSASTAPSALL